MILNAADRFAPIMRDYEQLNTNEASSRDDLASALAELLSHGEFPVVRAVLGLGPAETLDLDAGYTVPDSAYTFFQAVFSTYRFGEEKRFASPRELVGTPNREQVEAAVRTLVLYQPPHVPDTTTFAEFVFMYQMVAETYRKPADLPKILTFLMARMRSPDTFLFYFDFLVGRRDGPGWAGLKRDVHDLIEAVGLKAAGAQHDWRRLLSCDDGDYEAADDRHTDPAEGLGSHEGSLVAALTDLLAAGDFPVVRQVLGSAGTFEPDREYVLPDTAYGFLRSVFSTYRFDDENLRLFSPFEVVATPTRAELEEAVRTLELHQPPHSHEPVSFDAFMFRFHVLSKKFKEPDGIAEILQVLRSGAQSPVGHSVLFRLLRGFDDDSKWEGLDEDIRDLVAAASHRERPN